MLDDSENRLHGLFPFGASHDEISPRLSPFDLDDHRFVRKFDSAPRLFLSVNLCGGKEDQSIEQETPWMVNFWIDVVDDFSAAHMAGDYGPGSFEDRQVVGDLGHVEGQDFTQFARRESIELSFLRTAW